MENFKDRGRSQEAKMVNDEMEAFRKRGAAIRALAEWAEGMAEGAGAKVNDVSTGSDRTVIVTAAEATGLDETETERKFRDLLG